jgi:hypothetical protein
MADDQEDHMTGQHKEEDHKTEQPEEVFAEI